MLQVEKSPNVGFGPGLVFAVITIQEDEAVDSYLSRVRWVTPELFKRAGMSDVPHCRASGTLRVVAEMLGWHGCYGFNRLLHSHTNYPLRNLLHDAADPSFSANLYARPETVVIENDRLGLCYGCIAEDQNTLGFFYWRRSHQGDVAVCARHQIKLITKCGACGREFSLLHRANASWQPCECENWFGTELDLSKFPRGDLLHAQFRSELYKFGFQLPRHYVVKALDSRLEAMKKLSERWEDHVDHLEGGGSVLWGLHSLLIGMGDWRELNGTYLAHNKELVDMLSMMFGTFQEFLECSQCPTEELVAISGKWSTYATG